MKTSGHLHRGHPSMPKMFQGPFLGAVSSCSAPMAGASTKAPAPASLPHSAHCCVGPCVLLLKASAPWCNRQMQGRPWGEVFSWQQVTMQMGPKGGVEAGTAQHSLSSYLLLLQTGQNPGIDFPRYMFDDSNYFLKIILLPPSHLNA